MKKILLINKFLYPKGGDAICTLATGALFQSKGDEVNFWGMKHPDNPPYPHEDLFVDNLDLNNTGEIAKQLDIVSKLLYSLEAKGKIEKLIQITGSPDIVHLNNFAHQISPSILDLFKKNKIPCVMTMHDYKMVCASYLLLSENKVCKRCSGGAFYNCFFQGCVKASKAKSLLNTLEMYLHHKILHVYDYIHTFISPSLFMKNTLEEMGFKGNIVHIPNFIDTSKFIPSYEFKENSICYVGRLSIEKGVDTLIEAFKGIKMDYPIRSGEKGVRMDSSPLSQNDNGLRLKIIGTGPMEAELKAMALGMKNISFLGYKTGEDLKNEIRSSMFAVIPSEWYENNPLSVLEIFALGKPMVGACIGGIPELVKDNQTGLTFEPGNAEELRTKIRALVQNPEKIRQMGQSARILVEQEFNAQKYYERLNTLYEQLIEHAKK